MREKIVSEMADSDTGIQNVLTFEVLRKFLEMILKNGGRDLRPIRRWKIRTCPSKKFLNPTKHGGNLKYLRGEHQYHRSDFSS